jgi:ABC-2 type transport system permease protein
MAVFLHKYRRYSGEMTPIRSRFAVISKYARQSVFKSRIFSGYFAICFVPLLVMLILIYFKHNTPALLAFNINVSNLGFTITSNFFRTFTNLQVTLGFILTVIAGPPLISKDLSNNALPLYLCRPLSRSDYVIGKMMVIALLVSLITWVPLLLIFGFESYLEGMQWFRENYFVAPAILISSWLWIIVLALFAASLSAWVKWRLAASGLLFGIMVIPTPVTATVNTLFNTYLGTLFHPAMVLSLVVDHLFRSKGITMGWPEPPLWMLWGSIITMSGISVWLLALKVRAYEVIK